MAVAVEEDRGRKEPGSVFQELSASGIKEKTLSLSSGARRLGVGRRGGAPTFTDFMMCKGLRVLTEETAVSGNLWGQGKLPGGGGI